MSKMVPILTIDTVKEALKGVRDVDKDIERFRKQGKRRITAQTYIQLIIRELKEEKSNDESMDRN